MVKGKTELYKDIASRSGKVFVSIDSEILLNKISDFGFQISDSNAVITYGKSSSAFCKGDVGESKEFLSVITEGETIQTNLVGEYNFENVISAVCVGKYFGVEMKQMKDAIENYVPTNNRSQKISLGSNTIILDAYNANPSSMHEALKNFEKIEAKNKVVVLGQMMELGKYSQEEHQKIVAALSGSSWQHVKKSFCRKGIRIFKRRFFGFVA